MIREYVTRLRALRIERQEPTRAVARAIGVCTASLLNYELSKTVPRGHIARRLESYFHMPLALLLQEVDLDEDDKLNAVDLLMHHLQENR